MRKNVIGIAALASAVLLSGAAYAGDRGPSFEERQALQHQQSYGYQGHGDYARAQGFTVVKLNEVSNGTAALVNAKATPDNVQAIQNSIDPATRAELQSRGIQINNIVGATKAFNGNTVFYVR